MRRWTLLDTMRAVALLLLSRAERAIRPRLAAFGEYGFFRDRFADKVCRLALRGVEGFGGFFCHGISFLEQFLSVWRPSFASDFQRRCQPVIITKGKV